jgi:nicotinate-nucleotide adenylyltransferase
VLLMGADQYEAIETWHRWRDLAREFRIAVFARPGRRAPAGDIDIVPMAPSEVSASDIRARLANGEDVSALLPAAVLQYIRQQRLYC